MKQALPSATVRRAFPAAFGRLCVETIINCFMRVIRFQPPSGGCVLKQLQGHIVGVKKFPAAFGRLCVETT